MKVLAVWLPIAIAITVLTGTAFVLAHQNYRQNANDPQQQLAEDAASALNRGQKPIEVVPTNAVDQATSLAPFVIVLDSKVKTDPRGTPADILATNLIKADTGAVIEPVTSVFSEAEAKGLQRFTWETAGGLRFATVVVPYNGGFVLAARSSSEVERRVQEALDLAVIGWLFGLALSLATVWIVRPKQP